MMPLHQERLDVKVFLKVMLLFHTHTGPRSTSSSSPFSFARCRQQRDAWSQSRGTWCSGITPAQHAGGPGFNPQRVQFDLSYVAAHLGPRDIKRKVQS